MSGGPLMWDRLHIYHNPMTGSYHSPPTSGLLDFSDNEQVASGSPMRFDSSPPSLFFAAEAAASDAPGSPKRAARRAAAGGCHPMHMFCGFCLAPFQSSESERVE
mmetsp:Transcript_55607/g.143227  ORF Transcript_55607/g.143227 Transcript_55607/m.143227 type:complete len:105 (-) Transcript_55607:234-548(-)